MCLGSKVSSVFSLIFNCICYLLDANLTVTKRLNFSGATNATQLQKFVESNIVHRQGFTWGAESKKLLSVFIDDLNAPISDSYGVQRCNEVFISMKPSLFEVKPEVTYIRHIILSSLYDKS